MNFKLRLKQIAEELDHQWHLLKFEWEFGNLPPLAVLFIGGIAVTAIWFFGFQETAYRVYKLNFFETALVSIAVTLLMFAATFSLVFFVMAGIKWGKTKINQLEKTKRGGPC